MLGQWSNEHIVKSYVNGIPVSAVLARAGFQNHVHLIPRTTVKVDQELLDMIFPGVEQRHSEQVEVRYAMICPPMHNLMFSQQTSIGIFPAFLDTTHAAIHADSGCHIAAQAVLCMKQQCNSCVVSDY